MLWMLERYGIGADLSDLETASAKQTFLKSGIEAYASTPEELLNAMRSEMASMGKVLKAAGIGVKR